MNAMKSSACGAGFALVASLFSMASAATTARPLDIDHVTKMRSIQHLALSPDNRWIAYALCDPERVTNTMVVNSGCDIWVSAPDGNDARRLETGHTANAYPQWSPDSSALVFYAGDEANPNLWLWRVDASEPRRVSDVPLATFSNGFVQPIWLRDSATVIVKLKSEEHAQAATSEAHVASGQPAWAMPAVGESKAIVQFSSPASAQPTADSAPADLPSYRIADLGTIDIASGALRRLTRDRAITGYTLSPDERSVAFMHYRTWGGLPDLGVTAWTLEVIDLASGNIRKLASDVHQFHGYAFSWSPDSRHIAYLTGPDRPGGFPMSERPGATIAWVAASGGAPRILAGHGDFGTSAYYRPIWDPRGTHIYVAGQDALWRASLTSEQIERWVAVEGFSPDYVLAARDVAWSDDGGQSLLVAMRGVRAPGTSLFRVRTGSGEVKKQRDTDVTLSGPFGGIFDPGHMMADARNLIHVGGSASRPLDVWMTDLKSNQQRRVTTLNPQFEGYQFPSTRVVEYRSIDGRPLRAALLLPAQYEPGKRYPMLVWMYAGGAGSRRTNTFGLDTGSMANMHMLSTRGYAVLYPDIPVSVGTPALDVLKAVIPAVDKVIDMGIADADRLAAGGVSNGGFATLALIAQTPRFKAAIANNGYGDIGAFYGYEGWSEFLENGFGAMGVPPWEAPLRYVNNSPFYQLDRVRTPVLIQVGELDTGFNELSTQIYVGLKRLGREATLLKYPDEGHGVFKSANVADYWNRVVQFLDAHLNGASRQQ